MVFQYKQRALESCHSTFRTPVPTRIRKNGPSHEGPSCLGSLWLGEFFCESDLCRISTKLVGGRHLERLRSAHAAAGEGLFHPIQRISDSYLSDPSSVLDTAEVNMKEDSDDCIPRRKVFSTLVNGALPIPLFRDPCVTQQRPKEHQQITTTQPRPHRQKPQLATLQQLPYNPTMPTPLQPVEQDPRVYCATATSPTK
jgi:hypothetical protein